MRCLLDTNIISNIAKFPLGPAARAAELQGFARLCTSTIVACELRFGLEKNKAAVRTARQVNILLDRLAVEAFDSSIEAVYARVRAQLESRGTPIGALDTLIAAHALALDCTLVTDNTREFERVEGLRVENWLR